MSLHDPKLPIMTSRRKAALIVQIMLGDGSKLSLTDLPEHLQEALAMEMASIRLVDRDTVQSVAKEFSDLLEAVGLSAPGGANAAIDALADHLSPTLTNRLRSQFGMAAGVDPWPQIQEMELEKLVGIIAAESDQVSAVILSKLPVDKAAGILGKLPGDQARRVTIAVSKTADIAPDTVLRIGKAVLSGHSHTKVIAFETTPPDRVGAILNNSPASQRDSLLQDIEGEDEEFAKNVRKAIFTFADITTKVTPTDVPNILRGIDPEAVTIALAAALAEEGDNNAAAEFILANVSQRMAASMREEAGEKTGIKPAAAEEAMNTIAAAIKAQADAGDIALIFEDEEEDEDS